jgi:hypothetical protein
MCNWWGMQHALKNLFAKIECSDRCRSRNVDKITENFKILRLKKVNYPVRDPNAGSYEQGNDPSSSMQRGKRIPCKSNCCQ